MPSEREMLSALIERLERATGPDNALDVEIEIALFDPAVSVRANAAGTKLVYTLRSGTQSTHWAADYTLSEKSRAHAIALLHSLSSNPAQGEGR